MSMRPSAMLLLWAVVGLVATQPQVEPNDRDGLCSKASDPCEDATASCDWAGASPKGLGDDQSSNIGVSMLQVALQVERLPHNQITPPQTTTHNAPPEQPSCVVEKGRAISRVPGDIPASLEEAVSRPLNVRIGNSCYGEPKNNTIIDSAQCCCPFWPSRLDLLKPVPTLMRLSENELFYSASLHGCVASFPFYSFAPPPQSFNMQGHRIVSKEPFSGCGDVAVLVSGSLKNLATSLRNIQVDIVQPLIDLGRKADVFFHVGMKQMLDYESIVNMSLPPWLKGLVLEDVDNQSQVDEAIQFCTNGLTTKLIQVMNERYHDVWFDGARFSMQYMQRRIFLAYRMAYAHAHAGQCKYKYVVRTRPDIKFHRKIDWRMVEKDLVDSPLLIGAQTGLFRQRLGGVNISDRCIVDDQFSIGTMEGMGSYSSMLPDFQDFVRFVPLSRPDLNGHTNERLLTAYLHYRGVKFVDFPVNYTLHAA